MTWFVSISWGEEVTIPYLVISEAPTKSDWTACEDARGSSYNVCYVKYPLTL